MYEITFLLKLTIPDDCVHIIEEIEARIRDKLESELFYEDNFPDIESMTLAQID